MEQKPIPVEQVKPGPTHDGLNRILGLNQDKTMRIDTDMAKLPETCTTNSSSEELYICKFLYARAIHMARTYQMHLEIQNVC